MRYVLIVLALMLSGCATTGLKEDPPKTASMPTPCGKDNCGKPATWEYQ